MVKPKVFIVQDSGHDFTQAARWGQPVVLFTGKVNAFALGKLAEQVEAKLASASRDDMLLLAGNLVVNCLALHSLLRRLDRVQVLIYSFREEGYELRALYPEMFGGNTAKLGGTNGEC